MCVNHGDSQVRSIQQHLNRNYSSYTGIMPCDGHYSRDTNQALIFALQAEEGMSVSVANGYFGPGTTGKCPTFSEGSRGNLVRILQCALYVNDFKCPIDGVYGADTTARVRAFQSFVCLPETGVANMPTIKALLTSCGDTSRPAKACDCSVQLTYPKALALSRKGYECVGRYLTGFVGAGRPKNLTTSELLAIFRAGLRVFPIYQDGGWEPEYFSGGATVGERDGRLAVEAARSLRLPIGSIIYFAVDCDLYDYQVSELIIPYFSGVFSSVCSSGSGYLVGVYGARNICSRVSKKGYAVSSFVSGMSTGFSGNFGYPLPKNWAFDQFYELRDRRESGGKDERFVSPDGSFDLDKDAYSGRDRGVSGIAAGSGGFSAGSLVKMLPGARFDGTVVIMPETTFMLTSDLSVTMSKEISSTLDFTSGEVGAFYKLASSYNGGALSTSEISLGTFFNGFETSFSLLPPENGFSLSDIIMGMRNPSDIVRRLATKGGVGISATKNIGDKFSISIGGEVRAKSASINLEIEQRLNREELHKNVDEEIVSSPDHEIVKRDKFSINGHPYQVLEEMAVMCRSAVRVAAVNAATAALIWEVKVMDLEKSVSKFIGDTANDIKRGLQESFESAVNSGNVAAMGTLTAEACLIVLLCCALVIA